MIEHATILACFVFLCYMYTRPGNIFAWMPRLLAIKTPTWVHSPLFDCLTCMAPWYATVAGLCLGYFPDLHQYFETIILASAMTAAIDIIYHKIMF